MNSCFSTIADQIRKDITSGAFQTGSTLPPVPDLERRFKTGAFAIRHALSSLRDEGLLTIKKHVGSVVTGQHLARRKGRILFVTVGRKNNFFDATFAERLSVHLRTAGWEFTDVVIEAVEETQRDLSLLKQEIAYGVDYVLMNCASPRVAALLDEHQVRYAVTRGGTVSDFPHADVRFLFDKSKDLYIKQILDQVREQKLKTLLEVDFNRDYDHALTAAFLREGLHVRRIWGEGRAWKACGMRLVEQIGLDLVLRHFSAKKHIRQPPDLIVFMDDYLARGGLMALSSLGLKSPEDIKILTHSNHGNPPTYSRRLTCFESDPEQYARVVAKWTLARLTRKQTPPAVFPAMRFVKGETF